MLWLSLYFPKLSLEVWERGSQKNLALAVTDRQQIVARNDLAAAAGVEAGMLPSAAQALCVDLRLFPLDASAEQAALLDLGGWASQFTDRLCLRPPRTLLLEIAGSLRLFGGLRPLLTQISDGLETLGYRVRTGLAPTPMGAWLLSRLGQQTTTRQGLQRLLLQLPCRLLPLDEKRQSILSGLGLDTLGDCARQPRAGLARRLGPDLLDCIDRALGKSPDTPALLRLPTSFQQKLSLPAAVVGVEPLLFASRRLLTSMEGYLRAREQGVQQFELRLDHQPTGSTLVQVGLVMPSRDAAHLLTLLRDRLDNCALDGPVESISLLASNLCALEPAPALLFDEHRPVAGDWSKLVDLLHGRLEREQVHGIRMTADHRPEYAWRACPPGSGKAVKHAWPALRPSWILPEPLPLNAMRCGDYLTGKLFLRRGPERLEGGWWDGKDIYRDYYEVEAPDRARLWVYQDRRSGDWFLQGYFG